MWFQSQLDPAKTNYTRKDACDVIERLEADFIHCFYSSVVVFLTTQALCYSVHVFRYLCRFDEELEQIELVNGIKGRQGRLHSAREAVIKQTIERERVLYESIGLGESPLSTFTYMLRMHAFKA